MGSLYQMQYENRFRNCAVKALQQALVRRDVRLVEEAVAAGCEGGEEGLSLMLSLDPGVLIPPGLHVLSREHYRLFPSAETSLEK